MMIVNDKLLGFFKSNSTYVKYVSDGRELVVFCPICEQHSSLCSHGHMYISRETGKFHCFKCHFSGRNIINLIKAYNVDPKNILSEKEIESCEHFDKHSNLEPVAYIKKWNVYKHILSDKKKKYLEKRLGGVDPNKIHNLIPNIDDFIYDNNINIKLDNKFRYFLNTNFIGFLASRGTKIILRNCDHASEFRYYSMNLIDNKKLFYSDFYSIGVNSPRSDNNIIVMAEGIFDILSAYFSNSFLDIRKNCVLWSAILGSHFCNNINNVLDYCKLPVAHFVILSDVDKSSDYYEHFLYNNRVCTVQLYYNKHMKDFGDNPVTPVKFPIKMENKRYDKQNNRKNTVYTGR